ncbi:MAG: S-layer homology domain-containing protein [Oscillospiraceae bacterium]|nr:S-layer homology domain-containing protein [Oscillospiraceae bacterium]
MKKNFKRLLCLVLVVSLVCSLAVTASAASLSDYTDVDDITYVEAVDVLTSIGILEGTDGAFNGSENMTRAQAAKIIAYLALGADTASSLSATSAPFDDVALTHWAVGYIAYCASAGIIDGDGTGNFNPEDEVTAYQFGKMLLCTLGYGVNGEYTGASWAVTVAADAGSLGIYKDKVGSLSGNTAITRDEMALYTFNTLVNVAQVKYNATFGEYYVGTTALNAIDPTIKSAYQYGENDAYEGTAYKYTIGYQSYSLLKNDEGEDAFCRPSYSWEQDGATASDTYVNDDADYSLSGKITSGDLYSTLGKTVSAYDFTYYVDGVATDMDNPTKNDSDTTIAGRGSTTEVYVNDTNETVDVIIINTYFAQIADVDSDDDDEITVLVDVYDGSNGKVNDIEVTSDDLSNLAGLEEDDYVMVTIAKGDDDYSIKSISGTTSVEGAITAYAGGSTSIDGTKYNHNGTLDTSNFDDRDFDNTFTVYLDAQGNAAGYELTEDDASATQSYLLVTDSEASAYSALNGAATVKVAVTFTDGTDDVIYLKVSDATKSSASVTIAGTKYTVADYDDEAIVPETAYAYTVNSSGYYTLKALGSKANVASSVTTDSDTTAVKFDTGTLYATSSTKLVLVDDAKTYTGYTNFPNKTFDDNTVLYVTTAANGSRLSYIYVFGDATVSEELVYAMYKGDATTTSDGTEYNFWVNGSVQTYLFEDTISQSKYNTGFINVDSDGYATFVPYSGNPTQYGSQDSYVYCGTVTNVYTDSVYVDIDGETYVFAIADDCETTRISSSGNASSANPREDDTVYVFTEDLAEDNSNTAEAVALFAKAN